MNNFKQSPYVFLLLVNWILNEFFMKSSLHLYEVCIGSSGLIMRFPVHPSKL